MTLTKLPRKASAFVLTSLLVMTAGLIIHADRCGVVVAALSALYASFVAAHSYSDVNGSRKTEGK